MPLIINKLYAKEVYNFVHSISKINCYTLIMPSGFDNLSNPDIKNLLFR